MNTHGGGEGKRKVGRESEEEKRKFEVLDHEKLYCMDILTNAFALSKGT